MTKEDFIEKVNLKLKLIRNEKNYTQDKMAEILGMSKKTLVQIEKGRGSLGWSGCIIVCFLFKDSEILKMTLGDDIEDMILSFAFGKYEKNYNKTMGGKIWWKNIKKKDSYVVQQNLISSHFRILNEENRKICSSFDEDYINLRLNELCKTKDKR